SALAGLLRRADQLALQLRDAQRDPPRNEAMRPRQGVQPLLDARRIGQHGPPAPRRPRLHLRKTELHRRHEYGLPRQSDTTGADSKSTAKPQRTRSFFGFSGRSHLGGSPQKPKQTFAAFAASRWKLSRYCVESLFRDGRL